MTARAEGESFENYRLRRFEANASERRGVRLFTPTHRTPSHAADPVRKAQRDLSAEIGARQAKKLMKHARKSR